MTRSVGGTTTATSGLDPVEAVAAFFREDPARILVVASGLRGPHRSIESTVEGNSMGQTLLPGSRIRIELAERPSCELGEVVAFLARGKVVVHRVVHKGRRGAARGRLLTRGDAALIPDPAVDVGSVLGAVTALDCNGGWMSPGERPRRSLPARVVASLALAVVTRMLEASPRAANVAVELLHRGRRLRGACLRHGRRLAAS
jgi:hypothetical protein